MTPGPRSSYLKQLMLWFLLLLVGAALVNLLVDPYALFGTPRITGLSQIKPASANRLRISKPYQVRRNQPRALVGGNSRPEMGIDPGHVCWPDDMRPIYNLGLPGVGVYRQARTLQHASYKNDVVLILWGLDFADFLSPRHAYDNTPWPPGKREYEDGLVVNADGTENSDYALTRFQTYLKTLVSLDTLVDSLETVFQQDNPYSSNRLDNGFNPARDYISIIRSEGQQVLFQQKNREIEKRFSGEGLTIFSEHENNSEEFMSLEHLLSSMARQNIQVYLFINPYHIDYLSAIYRNGLWNDFELWKLQLAKIANRYHVPIWDFSIITRYNTEPSPRSGAGGKTLDWFWEPAHYKREVGDMMLETMLPDWCRKTLAEPVGIKLDLKSIDMVLEKERIKVDSMSRKEAL